MRSARRAVVLVVLLLLLVGGGVVAVVAALEGPLVGPGRAPAGSVDRVGAPDGAAADDDAVDGSPLVGLADHASGRRRVRPGLGAPPRRLTAPAVDGPGIDPALDPAEDADTEPETDAAPPGGQLAEPEPAVVRGRVVDAEGSPIADARVLVVRVGRGWHGDTSRADGSFAAPLIEPAPSEPGAGAPGQQRVEIRVRKPGYGLVIVPWAEGAVEPVEVRLEPESTAPLFGTIRGYATDMTGRPLVGRLLVEGRDAMEDYRSAWVIADAGGEFELPGVPPGHWRMRLYGGVDTSPDSIDVLVPVGGETRAHFVAGPEPWPGALSDEDFATRHRELSEQMTLLRTDGSEAGGGGSRTAWRTALRMQDLEARRRGTSRTREVVVTGLPDSPGAVLRAATISGPNHRWFARIADGEARFDVLTHEPWRLAILRPAQADEAGPTVTIEPPAEARAGPQRVRWPRSHGR